MSFFNVTASSSNWFFSQTTDEKIKKFKNLSVGWHYGKGIPPSSDTVTLSLRINDQAVLFGLKTDAFPGVDGEIQVNCYYDDETIELIIEPNGEICLVHDRNNVELESFESSKLSDVLGFLKRYGKDIWNLSGSSTQITMTSTEKDLPASHLETPLMAAEYQLY